MKTPSKTLLAAARLMLAISTTHAAEIVWSGASSTDFSLGDNWVDAVAPANSTATDIAVFGSALTANLPTLTENRSVNGLKFERTTGGWTLDTGAFTLILGANGINDTANVGGLTTITGNASVGSGTTTAIDTGGRIDITLLNIWTGAGIANFAITGVVSVGSLGKTSGGSSTTAGRKTGTGTLIVKNAATGDILSTNGFQLNGGVALIGHQNAFGSAGISFGGGSLGATKDLVEANKVTNNVGMGASSSFVGAHSMEMGGTFTRNANGGFSLNNHIFSGGGAGLTLNNGIEGVTATGAMTLTVGGAGNTQIQGVIANGTSSAIALTKADSGTLTLTNNNTYTGTTTVNRGFLVADYATANTVLPSGTALAMGGGTLEFKGRTGAFATSQTVGNITTSGSSSLSHILLNRNDGNGVEMTAGTIVPNATRSALMIDLGNSANSLTTTTDLTAGNVRVVLRDGTGRHDFAVNSGVDTAIAAMNAATDLIATPDANANYRLSSSTSITGGANQANTLRIAPGTDGQVLTLDAANANTNYRFNAILFDSARDFTITLADGKGGSIGTVGATGTNANTLLYHFGSGTLTVDAKMAGGANSASGTGAIELYGKGLIDWTRAASSSGTMTIGGVTLRQGSGNGMLTTNATTGLGSGNVALSDGGVWENSGGGDITRNVGTGAGAIQWLGDGGFSAFGGDRSVSLNSGAALTWETTIGSNNLVLGSNSSDARIDVQNDLILGSFQRTVHVNNGVNANDIDARLAGLISGEGALHKTGTGVLELTEQNTYTGPTFLNAGSLLLTGSLAAASTVYVGEGAVIGGPGTIFGDLNLAPGAFLAFDPDISLTLGGSFTLDNSFGVASLRTIHGQAIDWSAIVDDTYALLNTDFVFNASNIGNYGIANAHDLGNDRVAFFQNGSLELVVFTIPEPSSLVLLGIAGFAAMALFRRRK